MIALNIGLLKGAQYHKIRSVSSRIIREFTDVIILITTSLFENSEFLPVTPKLEIGKYSFFKIMGKQEVLEGIEQ